MRQREGFTLIEFLVAMSLFAIIVTISVGGFVRALRTERELVALMSVNSNMSLIVEQMAREIRTGHEFQLQGEATLAFKNAEGQDVIYDRVVHGDIGSIERVVGLDGKIITANNINVRSLKFLVMNGLPPPGDDYPARITISVTISPREAGLTTSESILQTTVSARGLGT